MHGMIAPPIVNLAVTGITGSLDFYWSPGTMGTKTISVTNPNEMTMTLTLGAWSDGAFAWVTSSPVTLAAGASTNLQVSYGGLAGAYHLGTAAVGWSVATGSSGSVTAQAEHDSSG